MALVLTTIYVGWPSPACGAGDGEVPARGEPSCSFPALVSPYVDKFPKAFSVIAVHEKDAMLQRSEREHGSMVGRCPALRRLGRRFLMTVSI